MISYRDIIWDFAPATLVPGPQETEARAAFRLRVYDSEMALFGPISSTPIVIEYPVRLSLGLASSHRVGLDWSFDRRSLEDAGQRLWHELPIEATSALRECRSQRRPRHTAEDREQRSPDQQLSLGVAVR